MDTTHEQHDPAFAVLSKLENVTQTGPRQWEAHCPVHDDNRNSLCIGVGNDGRVLVFCQVCGKDATPAILDKCGVKYSDLFPTQSNGRNGSNSAGGGQPSNGKPFYQRIEKTYDYRDASGKLVYQSVRLHSPKDFRQRRPKPGGSGWEWTTKGTHRVLYRLPELLAADVSRPVYIVEGEKDADLLISGGLVSTTSVGGASKNLNKPKWLKKYCELLKGRHVIFIPDNDDAGHAHMEAAARMTFPLAKSVRILHLPDLAEKGDVSDWVKLSPENKPRKLCELADACPLWEPPADSNEAEQSRLAILGFNGKPIEAADDPSRLAEIYKAASPPIMFWRSDWWCWDAPAYRRVEGGDLRAKLGDVIEAEFARENIASQAGSKLSDQPKPKIKVTRRLVSDVVGALESKCLLTWETEQPAWIGESDAPFSPHNAIVTTSGVINLPALFEDGHGEQFIPPTPDLFTGIALGFGYYSKATCPHWLTFLRELWPDDEESIGTLQEMLGYFLTTDTSQQKLFMLIGPKRSGKGTISRVIRELIGLDNAVSTTLGGLDGTFALQPLLNKTVACIGDARLSTRRDIDAIVERLLSISGEDAQTVDRKHKQAVTTMLKVRFLILSNELPQLADASATLPSRLILLKLTESFYGREDTSLTERLLGELPGILNWAIVGWKRLQDRGQFVQPNSSQSLIDQMAELSSPIHAFVADRCELGTGRHIETRALYAAWKSWSEENGRRSGTAQSFGKNLRAAFPEIDQPKQLRDAGRRLRVYEGIDLFNAAQPFETNGDF